MAPRTGPRVKVISPNSGTVTTLSRSVSVASSLPFSAERPHLDDDSCGSDNGSPAEKPLLRRLTAAAAAAAAEVVAPLPSPPQSGRSVLRTMGINTASAVNGKTRGDAPSQPVLASRDRADLNYTSGGSSRGNRGLTNLFDEAERRRAVHAAPTTDRRRRASSVTPRSDSRGEVEEKPSLSQTRHIRGCGSDRAAAMTSENEAAIQRARAALEHAGDTVLRHPFSSLHSNMRYSKSSSSLKNTPIASAPTTTTTRRRNTSVGSSVNESASTLLGGSVAALQQRKALSSSLSLSRHGDGGTQRRGMRLPSTILISPAGSVDSAERADDAEGYRSRDDAEIQKRARSWGDAAAANAVALARRRTQPFTSPTTGTERAVPNSARVCPGMFSGASAIPLDASLFAGIESCDSDASNSSELHNTKDTITGCGGVALLQPPPQRYCARPLWSLVGTFKTSLSGLVAVNFHQGCLRWFQRNPKGGQQCIKVPLSHVLDVFTTRVVQEDENVEEQQFTVVVRTSTRPSQVVFGFATVAEANRLRHALMRHHKP